MSVEVLRKAVPCLEDESHRISRYHCAGVRLKGPDTWQPEESMRSSLCPGHTPVQSDPSASVCEWHDCCRRSAAEAGILDDADRFVKSKQTGTDEDDNRGTCLDPRTMEVKHDEDRNNKQNMYDIEYLVTPSDE